MQIYTPQNDSLEWAKAQRCLGMLYLDRVRGKRSANLAQAKESLEAALQAFPREFSHSNWTTIQALLCNLSLALEEA